MDDPFGVEYFTRSDDEGFGVIYISHWKLSDSEDEENNGGHEKHTGKELSRETFPRRFSCREECNHLLVKKCEFYFTSPSTTALFL